MIIRKLRLEKGLSQEQLAYMAGISTRTLQRIERGAKASPETLKCLGSVLEINLFQIQKDDPMPETQPNYHRSDQTPMMSPEEYRAMEYVRDVKAFYSHAIVYAFTITGLTLLNLTLTPQFLWVAYAAGGWGIGLFAHGASTFELFNFLSDDWEKRQIKKRMEKTRRS